MPYTFDGANRRIILSPGTTALDVQDCYSRWKQWAASGDHLKWLPFFRVVGGDPTTGGQRIGSTYFLMNGCQIRPYEASHTLDVIGNLYHDDGLSVFAPTLGNHTVLAVMKVSNLVDTIETGGAGGSASYTPSQIAEGILSAFIEQSLDLRGAMRLLLSFAAGDASGLDGSAPAFRDLANTKNRISATMENGNRTITARDAA